VETLTRIDILPGCQGTRQDKLHAARYVCESCMKRPGRCRAGESARGIKIETKSACRGSRGSECEKTGYKKAPNDQPEALLHRRFSCLLDLDYLRVPAST